MSVRQDLFKHVIDSIRCGSAQEELSEKLNECVQHARRVGKATELTLTIKIKPNGTSGQYELKDVIKTKMPPEEKGSSYMFGTPEGNLTQTAPTQESLDLRPVADDTPKDFKRAE